MCQIDFFECKRCGSFQNVCRCGTEWYEGLRLAADPLVARLRKISENMQKVLDTNPKSVV